MSGARGRGVDGRDSLVHDDDSVHGDGERLADLSGDVRGRGVHPGPAPKRPPDQLGERQRLTIAELGKPKGGEVVHGDDLRSARWGDDEVGAVHDVNRSRPGLDARNVGAAPHRPQGPRRHRPIDDTHARRHRGRKGPSSPPRQCIRCDFDIVSVGEGSQDTSGEGAHSRRQAEQWGGIEGDPQCSHVSYDGRWCGRP